MIRKALYFSVKQINNLNGFKNLTFSEHVRRAVDEYIDRIKEFHVSASASKRGDENG